MYSEPLPDVSCRYVAKIHNNKTITIKKDN